MDLDLDDEQRELRDTVRRFLEREAPIARTRAMAEQETAWDRGLWTRMAELGWMALPFAEEHGGLGLGMIELALVVSEMGRVVLPEPFVSTMIAGLTIADAGTAEQRERLVPRIAAGDLVATLALDTHVASGAGRVGGAARMVADGEAAEVVVVDAGAAGGRRLVMAEPSSRRRRATMDLTRRVADLRFDDVAAEPLGGGDDADVERARDRAALLLSAEMLGIAERALEISVAYANERVQFGRPIGSFQAIKHKAADMHVDVESCRAAVYYAAWAQDRDHLDASVATSAAKAYASDAVRRVTSGGIQVHGGIGFTWEHDMHLYFKRAKADEVAFGDATAHRERLASLLRARYAEA